jgi:MoxR-like ATPase
MFEQSRPERDADPSVSAQALPDTADGRGLRAVAGRSEPATPEVEAALARAHEVGALLLDHVAQVVRGKRSEIELVIASLACEGHVLFEDVPGTAKTVLVRAIAQSIDGAIPARIQCTPDLQPSDVTGLSVYDPKSREFEFRPGPIFANIVLVDEINRAMPKTQSALLEAMAERQVTVDGITRTVPDPFLLLATENPIEHEGTYLLPEAQLDRFFLRSALGYASPDDELQIVQDQRHGHPLKNLGAVVTIEDVRALQKAVEEVYVDELIQRWIIGLVRATRGLEAVDLGASVRGSLALERGSRALALLKGRDYVVPEDVEALFAPVVLHRLLFTPTFIASSRSLGRDEVVRHVWESCLERSPRPALALG